MPQVRGEFGQGLQDEAALRQARVWNFQAACRDNRVAVEQDIHVDDARAVGMRRDPSKSQLDRAQVGEELLGGQAGFDLDHLIQEPILVDEIARLGFVNG